MKIISSELYVKDNKVYHEGNKPKPKDIGAAPETHTHNYASATTPGGSAEHAIKATEDNLGQRIDKYIKGLSVSGRTITYTRGDGTTGTITTQDNNTDTKVTNTLNTTAKAYITGTTESATNTGTQVFDTNVYLDTTAGMLTATTFKGALQGNAATATSATSATSATKLATARTINGTNFDGTGNITTANWGTARNIQIGNSSKSVNGSSNMTWTLAEIGAAPDGHTHNYAATSHKHGLLHDNFGVTIENTTTDNGWSMINSSYNGFLLKSLRSSANAPAWLQGDYSAGIAFGGADTKGVMSVAYNRPSVRFAGGNGSKPVWHFTVNGSSGKTYNMDSLAANTANTLATPRTINGTNFNGSANITTANWGTARNIQIGNTAKSVNGSSNVTWSLSEIGAAPASHSHSYLPLSGGKVSSSEFGTLKVVRSGSTNGAAIGFENSNGVLGYVGMNGAVNGGLVRYSADTNSSYTVLDTGNYKTTVTPANIGAAASGHTHNYAGSSSAGGNANAAVKLATARTINGTNFDGTANITTANWGTARNIKVGATKKSVNGSGDVAWSLNEIGAAKGKTISATTAATAGWYRIATSSAGISRNLGTFVVEATVSGKHSITEIVAGTCYGQNPTIQQLSHTAHSATGISKARIVYHTTYDGNYAYLEVYLPAATATTINVHMSDYYGWSLVTPSTAGSIPSGYSNKEITLAADRIVSNFTGSLSGNASTATTLQTARTINGTSFNGSANITTANWGTARNIQIGNTAKSVNGSGNVTWSLSEIGAAAASHTHSYLPLSGGTLTGELVINYSAARVKTTNGTNSLWFGINSSGDKWGIYDITNEKYLLYSNGTDVVMSGNASTATKLQTARTINGTNFDGTSNITTANWGTARNITIGNTTKSVNGSGNVSWNLSEIGAAASSHTHNYAGSSSAGGAANTAVKLATARTIALGGILSGSASFDGSGNVTINATANDITTITKSLNVTTSWADTGITGSNLGTGTYAVQMHINDGANTGHYNEYYSGIMSWYADGTNSTDADEILLHKAGHASNGRHVYLRTIRTGKSGSLKLQISCTHAFSAASNITFKFKKLI